MIKRWDGVFLRCAVCAAAAIFFASGAAAKTYTLKASSSKFFVVDGDTAHYGQLKFRLCGIQAPEKYDPPGYALATKMLKRLLGEGRRGAVVRAHVVDTDKYSRKVAVMFAGGDSVVSVNEKMVRQGGAKHYRKFSHNCEPLVLRTRFDAAEKHARKRRLGIWRK